jgi:hypothetical protein
MIAPAQRFCSSQESRADRVSLRRSGVTGPGAHGGTEQYFTEVINGQDGDTTTPVIIEM